MHDLVIIRSDFPRVFIICFNRCDIWAVSGIFFLEIKLFWYVNTTHLFDLFHT